MSASTAPVAAIVTVDNATDPRLDPFRNVRDRDLWRSERFLVEGEVATRIAFSDASRFAVESLLVADSRVSLAEELRALCIERADSGRKTPSFLRVSRKIMEELCGFDMHRGVLACARRRDLADAALLLPSARLVCVLLGLTNHDNVGGIFRSAKAFGVNAILVSDSCCDPLYRKAIRVSSGSTLTLPYARGTDEALLDVLAAHDFSLLAMSPKAELRMEEITPTARTALLLGTEGPGLSDAILRRGRALRIAMRPGFDSLNVAAATSIALYELTRGSTALT